jgi:NADH dehydrogenase/NADH:ubiquinone oxidoreductase subunit G
MDSEQRNSEQNRAEIENAKAEADRRINQAVNDTAKRALEQQMIQNLNLKDRSAGEIAVDVLNNKNGKVSDEKKPQAKEVKKAIVEIMRGVEKNLIQPNNENSRKLLNQINQNNIIEGLDDASASLIYSFVQKAVTG